MVQSPKKKVKPISMPEATHHKGNNDAYIGCCDGSPSQFINMTHFSDCGPINIIRKPRCKGHVPISPELLEVSLKEWVIEVFRKVYTYKFPTSDGHISVAGKIKIDVKHVRIDAQNDLQQRH